MKIILVYRAASDMAWEERYDAAGVERALAEEREHGAAPVQVKKGDASAYRIYTGTDRAARETAELLFDFKEPPEATPLLDDVPLRAWQDSPKQRPLSLWRAMGELQWRTGSPRQPEKREDTLRRAGELTDLLEQKDADCIVIARGLTMKALKTVLRRRGYTIDGGSFAHKPLDRMRAMKQLLRCGGCNHNCPLTNPKCDVGRNKAKAMKGLG